MRRLRSEIARIDRMKSVLRRQEAEAAEARPPASPPEQATIGAARHQLQAARGHLDKSRSLLDRRQAAEKGWLALMTAGRALLKAAGEEDWARTSRVAERVTALEERRFKRARVGSALARYQRTLHGRSFYAGEDELSDADYIRLAFEDIEEVIGVADAMRGALAGRVRR